MKQTREDLTKELDRRQGYVAHWKHKIAQQRGIYARKQTRQGGGEWVEEAKAVLADMEASLSRAEARLLDTQKKLEALND